MARLIGIIVCYYPQYQHKSVKLFKDILDSITKDNKLIVVNNNPELPFSNQYADAELKGSNTCWEFSGWDESFRYITKNKISNNPLLIMANDTFCQHRFFGKLIKLKLILAIKKQLLTPFTKRVMGFTNSIGKEVNVFNMPLSQWISSYIFSIRLSDLKSIYPLSQVTTSNYKNYFHITDKRINFQNCDDKFNTHMNNWLFPNKENQGWYKNNKAIPLDILIMKAITIANEKLLSLRCEKENIRIVNIDKSFISQILNVLSKII